MLQSGNRSRREMLSSAIGFCVGGTLLAERPASAATQPPVTIRVGSGTVEPNAQVFYALDQGFFKKNGLDAQLTILRSGGVTMEAIAAGQLDVGVANTVSLGAALLRKIPFVIIAPGIMWDTHFPNTAIAVTPASPVKTAKDFNGQTVGVTSLGSIDALGWSAYMDAQGGDMSTVKFIEVPPSAMADMIASGRVAAGIINDPELSNAIAAGKVRNFVNVFDYISKLFYGTVWLANRDWLANNKDTARRFASAIVAGGNWAERNRDQSLVVLEKYTKFHEDKSVAQYGKSLNPAYLQPVWDSCYKYKLYNAPLRATDYCWDGK